MTPNGQSLAYGLVARRPIVPQAPDILAADLSASQEPETKDGPTHRSPKPLRGAGKAKI